jgi:hypothetical protein
MFDLNGCKERHESRFSGEKVEGFHRNLVNFYYLMRQMLYYRSE